MEKGKWGLLLDSHEDDLTVRTEMVFFTWEVLGLSCVQSRHYPCSGLVMVWLA